MRIEIGEPCPLPGDPILAEAAEALRQSDDWGWIVDPRWRVVFVTDQTRLSMAGGDQMAAVEIGEHLFGPEFVRVDAEARFGIREAAVALLRAVGGLVLTDTPGGHTELRAAVDSTVREIVDGLAPSDATFLADALEMGGLNTTGVVNLRAMRVRDAQGALRGTILLGKPAVPMTILSVLAFQRDLDHLQRMFSMTSASRRAGAILFADLESSSALARQLSTSRYFTLVRRIVRSADECIVEAGGLVGRHVGDGVVAFFPVESFVSESEAARACIGAARSIQGALSGVAERSGLAPDELVVRFGLHWGATLFMGSIVTSARTEVTALGDEANETARIEACATGGRTLASKQLVERLDLDDAAALGIDPDQLEYQRLSNLDTATEKARRDAPAIAVCDV